MVLFFSWKHEGPSDSFKALVDMAAVHSSCRLCIFLATKIRDKEEMATKFQKRPCKCTAMSGIVYHLYVRERGRFHMESIFLRFIHHLAINSSMIFYCHFFTHFPQSCFQTCFWRTYLPSTSVRLLLYAKGEYIRF